MAKAQEDDRKGLLATVAGNWDDVAQYARDLEEE